MKTNVLYYGDNLSILRNREYFPDSCADLIYLDPPFNSKATYNVLFKEPTGEPSQAQITAFEDTWHWGIESERALYDIMQSSNTPVAVKELMNVLPNFLGNRTDMRAYLVMMCIRLLELKRVLKNTGSIYLHCDPTASHYLKILMDSIFEPKNFRNEIVWRRTGAHGPRRMFGPIHDIVLFYSKSNEYYFRAIHRPYMKGHVERRYTENEEGRLKFTSGGNVLTGAGTTKGESGSKWRGFDPSAKNRHWAIPGFLTEQMPPEFASLSTLEKLEGLYQVGLIDISEDAAWPTPVRFLSASSGQPVQDIWAYQPYTEGTVYNTDEGIDADVAWLGTTDPERTGYQTQKPLGLLERIIRSSSREKDVVLDPFCGCGTALISAQKAGRRWIGIDITHLAIGVMKYRLRKHFSGIEFSVIGEPEDLAGAEELARQNKYQFQWWAVSLVGGQPYGDKKKGADTGIDGYLYFMDEKNKVKKAIMSVKGGNTGVKDIRDLGHVIDREKAEMGIFITLEKPTTPMNNEAIAKGLYHSPLGKNYPRIQILTIEALFNGSKPDVPPWIAPVQPLAKHKGKKPKSIGLF
jgi:site-specific DNA-methyltransferase (adenine-specific)